MRLYIAAPWVDKDKMAEIAAQFEAQGHVITHKWWDTEDSYEPTPDRLEHHAALDMMGALSAETLILMSTGKSEGKAVEQGLAIAAGTNIIAIGRRGEYLNIFHYLPNYTWVSTIQEALACLQT